MELAHLKGNGDVIRKVSAAYKNQVEVGGGWGFTVILEGLRVRFDVKTSGKTTSGDLGVVYEGGVVDGLNADQTRQLTLNLEQFQRKLEKALEEKEAK
jgi:hypothetical protein